MNSDILKRTKSSLDKESKNTIDLDIILDLISNILRKEEGEKCICSNKIPEIDDKNTFYENEIIPNLEITRNFEGKIKLSDVLTGLKLCGYPLTGAMISLYFRDVEDFVFVGSDPIDSNILLDESHYSNGIIKIRAISYIEEKYINSTQLFCKNNLGGLRLSRNNSASDKKNVKSKRTKERKIGYIIEKVNTWRKFYNGFYDEYGKFTKYSLDDAAKMIGISKKSLDDYLLQLRLGRKYGFDFNSNKAEKVGILRSFVKKHRPQKGD